MLQKSMQIQEALAREEQNKLVSSFKTQPQEKKSTLGSQNMHKLACW